jgi:hypothetical protein
MASFPVHLLIPTSELWRDSLSTEPVSTPISKFQIPTPLLLSSPSEIFLVAAFKSGNLLITNLGLGAFRPRRAVTCEMPPGWPLTVI